jgi:predicted transcriptional regulator YdeE
MQHELIGLPSFTVVGLEQQGPASSAFEWVPPLWKKLTRATHELEHPLDIQGSWGLMSDAEVFLAPWKEQGRYLAGWQVPRGTEPPPGWTSWTLPPSSWVRVAIRMDQYADAQSFLFGTCLPEGPWEQAGAVHEFYPREFRNPNTDILLLCMPLRPRESPTSN